MNHGKRLTKLGLAAAIGLGMGNAHAVLQSYTDFAAFKADLLAAGLSYRLHDFNNLTPGTVVNEGNTHAITHISVGTESPRGWTR
jgi:hypothetical protein